MSAGPAEDPVRLADFPAILMSLDEPWADATWEALAALWPDARRVHGVRGLNACHRAAAEAAGTDWFLTVDADTRVLPEALDVSFSRALLSPNHRLDWQSRNAVNGLVTGNGSLKLWPRRLAMEMRSHEAAPADRISLDADIGAIRPGRSRLVLMAGCVSVSDPAVTPAHAFRAGFRETAFLSHILKRHPGAEDLAVVVGAWCSIGRHVPHGPWLIHGARLGLWAETTWTGWDIRRIHDYGWLDGFWRESVLPRIGPGGASCPLTGTTWSPDRLEDETRALGAALSERTDFPIAELGRAESRMATEAAPFPAARAAQLDELGRACQKGKGMPTDIGMAEALYREAALLGHVAAWTNLGRLHQLGLCADPDPAVARTCFEAATRMGSPHAPHHLATLLKGADDPDTDRIEPLLDTAAERGVCPEDA